MHDESDAAHSVTISAAAEEESMNHRPECVGISALSSTPSTTHFLPIFWMLPSAFSSMVVSRPRCCPWSAASREVARLVAVDHLLVAVEHAHEVGAHLSSRQPRGDDMLAAGSSVVSTEH
jgi:hypothetical protein